MGKILSWLLMAIAGYLVWRLAAVLKRKAQASVRGGPAGEAQGTGTGTGTGQSGKVLADERIVPCAHCGVHFPASEAVEAGGRLYCCPAHRDADRPA